MKNVLLSTPKKGDPIANWCAFLMFDALQLIYVCVSCVNGINSRILTEGCFTIAVLIF